MNILFLTTIHLTKNCNGGEVASQWFIDAIKNLGHQVTVVGYLRQGDKLKDIQARFIVDERYTETRKSKISAVIWLLYSLWKNLPYSSAKYYSQKYVNLVKKLIKQEKYDIIIIDHAQLSWLRDFLKADSIVAIAHNIEHEMYEEISAKSQNSLAKLIYKREALLIKAQENSLVDAVDQIWTLTDYDSKYFSRLGSSSIVTLGITPSLTTLQPKQVNKSFDIGLLGSWSWKANIEALQWFLQAVYPYLPTNISIHIAGKGGDWLNNKYSNITYRGVVPDAQEFMTQAKVVAIPTLSGSGIQIKTLDAITSGSFVVATPVALRGISQLPSTVEIAADAEEFAKLLTSKVMSLQANFDEAKNWYYQRHQKFLNDIACAFGEISYK
jgi:hypothetical protein